MTEPRSGRSVAAVAVFVVVAAVFASTIGDYLVWSDFFQLDQGHMIVRQWSDREQLWFPDQLRENNYLRPVQVLSNSLDGLIWGERWAGFHLTSVLLHAGNAVLLFLLGVELLARAARGAGATLAPARAVPIAAAAAILWGVHTWKTESVAWIADRCNPLQGFTLLALLLGLRALRHGDERPDAAPRARLLAAAAAAFLVGVLAKEVAIVVPALLVLAHWQSRLGPPRRHVVATYATLGGLALAYLVVRRAFLWYPAQLQVHYDLGERALTQLVVTAENLRGVFWPFDPRASDVVRLRHGVDAAVLLAGAVLLGVAGLALWRARRGDRRWAFALGWFLVCLAPTANLVAQRHFRGDRYLYLASWAPILVTVWAVDGWAQRVVARRAPRLAALLAPALLLAVLVPVVHATMRRNAEWSANDATNRPFFATEVARSPNFREGLGNLCRAEARLGNLDAALAYCRRGWAIDEGTWTSTAWQPPSFYALSFEILWAQHDCAGATTLTREAIARWPHDIEYKRRLSAIHRSCQGGLPVHLPVLPDGP